MILGLTGAYCAGKNQAARILEGQGWYCIDVDRLGHAALASCLDQVAALLGPAILNPDGSANRKAIGAAVFANPGILARYEEIVHPAMFRLCDQEINAALARGKKVCINAMVLYKMPQAGRCDAILLLASPLCQRLFRGMKRDRLSIRKILDRIIRQRSILALGSLHAAGTIRIMNCGSLAALEKKVLAFLESMEKIQCYRAKLRL